MPITVVHRIIPLTGQSGFSANLLKPSDVGKPFEVHERFESNPKTGEKFLHETTYCHGKTKDLSKLNIPGFIPVDSSDCAVQMGEMSLGRKFALSIPRHLPLPEIPQLDCFSELKELKSSANKPHIKLHLNLKKIREATKKKLIRKNEKLGQLLFKYFINNECLICGTILNQSRKSEITSHMLSHVKLGTYVCEICDVRFPSASTLYSHSVKHHRKMEYVCKVCDFRFNRKLSLSLHYEMKHNNIFDKSPSYLVISLVCSVCRVLLTSWKSLVNHKKAHFGKENYYCIRCNKVIASSCNFLRYHAHVRCGLKCHKCKYCHKTFLLEFRLREHEKRHRKVIKHLCEICGKQFNFRYNFWKHMQLHSHN